MLASLLDRMRNEVEVGVPRRFSIGTLFVLLTIYCIMFRLLVLMNADATWTALVCLMFGAVTLGQMVLFQGLRPRAASIVAGAVACPAMLVGLAVDEISTRWSGWAPLAAGLNGPGIFAAALLLLAMVGSGLGYLVGCATGGVFYVIGKILPQTHAVSSSASGQEPARRQIATWLEAVGRWTNPIQPRAPLRVALASFLIPVAFGFLIAPFITWLATQHVMMAAVVLGACLAVWSGNLQLWLFWPIALAAVGVVAATAPANALAQLSFFQDNFQQQPNVLHYLVRALGGLLGITVSAIAGWLQWTMDRHQQQRRLGVKALAGAIMVLVAIAVVVTQRISAWSHSPTQQLITRIRGNGDYVYWNADQTLQGVSLSEKSGDDDFLQLRPLLANPFGVDLTGSTFTNLSVRALDGLRLFSLTLSGTSMTDQAFDGMSDFTASAIYLSSNDLSDAILAGLVAIPRMGRVLESLALDRTKISDQGLLLLASCGTLKSLSLNDCEITDAGLANLAGITSLRVVSLAGCPISDDGLKSLVQSVPRLTNLTLDRTEISDAGLAHLTKAKGLIQLRLMKTQVTEEGITALRAALPGCAIRWSDSDP